MVLRSTEWDGPAPCVGDLLIDSDGCRVAVVAVAAGPGCGQYRLEVREPSVFVWRNARGVA